LSTSPLTIFLFEVEERVVNEATKGLRLSPFEHYRQMETIDLRPRIQALFEAYRESVINDDPTLIRAFTADIGRKRLQQGYALRELLFVLDALADALWDAAAESFGARGAGAFGDFRRLARGIAWGKDCVATVFAEETKEDLAALRRLSAAFNDYLALRRGDRREGPAEEEKP
jgi:hypothetical protein